MYRLITPTIFYLFVLSHFSCLIVSADSLTVLCWNVRNYLASNQIIDTQWRPEYPKPEHEKAALRAIILQADADIIFFQEMGSEPYLRELQRDLAKLDRHYYHKALGTDRDEIRHLAVLSKLPLDNVITHQPGMRRGIMQVEFQWQNHHFQFYNVHLKSRYTIDRDDPQASRERQLEMQNLIDITLSSLDGSKLTFILGDFNEPPDGPARQNLLNNLPNLEKLPASDNDGNPYTFHWQRGDTYESIDAIYYLKHANTSHFKVEARILSSKNVNIASDHRPILMKIKKIP